MRDTSTVKPRASLSLDLDNEWAYLKTQGEKGWESFPSYLPDAVPKILECLEERKLKATFFVVGKDAELEGNHEALRQVSDANHEVANHSYMHEPWLQNYSEEELNIELDRSESAIKSATGVSPKGWRGPGFSGSATLRRLLCRRGYQYDASTFPTFLGFIARTYFFLNSDLPKEEKKERAGLYGSFRDGFLSLKPFVWQTEEGELLEIPVSTMPIVKAPIHASYLLFLARYSEGLALAYLKTALWLHRLFRVEPSFLLHPTDFLGGDEVPSMKFFPAMDLDGEKKRAFMRRVLGALADRFEVLPMGQYCDQLYMKSLPVKVEIGEALVPQLA